MNVLTEIICPVFDEFSLRYQADDGQARLRFVGDEGSYDVVVKVLDAPPLLWLRFLPRIRLAELPHTALLELALTLNAERWLVKLGLDRQHQELVCDVELPLGEDPLTATQFGVFFLAGCRSFEALLPLLQQVRWGGCTVPEALDRTLPAALSAADERAAPPPSAKWAAEIRDILMQWEGGENA